MAKILFIQNYTPEVLLGVNCIASYIEPRHHSKVISGESERVREYCNSFKPDIVGISALSKDHCWVLDIAGQIKRYNPNIFVLVGGPHATFYPDILKETPIDAVCIGEGEKPVMNLLNAFETDEDYTRIPSLWIKKGANVYKNAVDTLLAPADIPVISTKTNEAMPGTKEATALTVLCSRGCPFSCNYCANHGYKQMYGAGYFRIRKTADIVREIKNAIGKSPVELIRFQDDIFGVDEKWLDDFLREYKTSIGLPFYCLLRIECINEKLLENLKGAGCFRIGIGIESGDERVRNYVLGRKMSTESIKNAAKLLHKHKISFHSFNMFGLPSENYRSAWETFLLNIAINPTVAYATIFQPYPGTKFFSADIEREILGPDFDRFKINHRYDKDSMKIQRLQKFFMLVVKFPGLRYFLPLLVRLPLDKMYDSLAKILWEKLYNKKLSALQ